MKCRTCSWLLIGLVLASALNVVAWLELDERVDQVERLTLSTSCAVLRRLHWDDPTRPDCAASNEP